MASNNTTKKIAAGAVIAGTMGFLAGILFAPKSGKETREDLKKGALKAKTEIEKKLKQAHKELNALMDEAKKQYDSFSKSLQKEVDSLIKQAKKAQEDVSHILSALREGEVEDPDLKAALDEALAAKDHLKTFLTKNK